MEKYKPLKVGSALITPMDGVGLDSKVDYNAFRKLIEYNIKGGVDAIIPGGCTGQSSLLATPEKIELLRCALNYKERVKIIPGAGLPSTKATIELIKEMEWLGADTFLLVSPSVVKPTQGGMLEHYSTIAANIDPSSRLIMYSVPGRTGGKGILPETAEQLASIDNIVGIKEASGDMERIKETIERTKGQDFYVWSGDDNLTIDVIEAGGYGIISVASNVEQRLIVEAVNVALKGRFEEARDFNHMLKPLYEVLFIESNPIPVHYALARLGIIPENPPRLPLTGATEATKEKVDNVLISLGLIDLIK